MASSAGVEAFRSSMAARYGWRAAAMANEFRRGVAVLASGEARAGAARFAKGAGRHGAAES